MTRTTFRVLLGVAIAGAALVLVARTTEASLRQGSNAHWYVVGGVLLVGLQTALIAGLVLQRAQRRRVDARLLASQQRYALATSIGRVGCWDWNLDTNELYVDPQLKRILGFDEREQVNSFDEWQASLHPDDAEATTAEVLRSVHGDSVGLDIEYRMIHTDGSVRWILTRGCVMPHEDGKAHRVVGTSLDITERRQASERFRFAMEAAPAGMLMADASGRILLVNSHLEQLFGYTREELIGQPVEILVPARLRERHPHHRRDFAQNPRARAMGADQDVAGLHKNGTEVPISIELNPLHTPEGDFVLGSIMDITDRKRAERETQDLMRRLRQLAGSLIQAQEVERARIARDLHDDVGQQLAGLSIALSGLKRRVGAAPDDGLQAEVSSLQRRAAGLAENVRRLSHDLHPAVLEHVGLEAALSAHCLEVQRGHAILVTFMPTGDASALAPGVALCLYRTAQEGLRNVVQHSRARHAEVRLVCSSDTAELTVADNGVGFDITTARNNTSGLGLVSIRERVRLLGGALSIVTESGKGTRVVIRIPLLPLTPPRDAAMPPDAPRT